MDVHKPLVSAYEMVKRGNKIVLDSKYSYFLNKATGVKTKLLVKNGVYTFPVWLDPAEHPRKEDMGIAPMKDVTTNEKQAMPAPSFQRRAGWP